MYKKLMIINLFLMSQLMFDDIKTNATESYSLSDKPTINIDIALR